MFAMHGSVRVLTWISVAALAVLLASVGVLGYYAIANRAALCSFTADLQTRVDNQKELLRTQPGEVIDVFAGLGGPEGRVLYVPRVVLQNQVASQEQTLDSIKGGWPTLGCK